MTEEQVVEAPVYVVEEEDDEEETLTIDFDNETIYQKEEHLVVGENLLSDITYNEKTWTGTQNLIYEGVKSKTPHHPPFKNELQDLLLNSVTSKAVASLLSKHKTLDTELDKLMESKRMGELGSLLESEMDSIMNKRRMELRACFVGSQVRFENIPDWAKSYVREYIQNMIHGLAILVEDGE